MVGQWVALQIQQEQCASCESPQRRDHIDHLVIREMVQHGRAKNEVEGAFSEGKPQRIRYNPWRRGVSQVRPPMIERNDLRVSKMAGKAPTHVSGSGAYIENGKRLGWIDEIPHDPQQSVIPPKPAVDPGDVA